MKKNNQRRLIYLAVLFIVICEAIGIIGSLFTFSSVATWYQTLQKPLFNPPAWIFGPVWTTLYALMGIALARIWILGTDKPVVRESIMIFSLQLLLNAVWSPVFFGAKNILLALIVICIMLIFIILTTYKFYKLDRVSGLLFVPYAAWVSFAAYLNYVLWTLN